MAQFCSKCKKNPPAPRQRYCMECHAEYQRLNRDAYKDLSADAKLKAICRSYTNVLVSRGLLAKEPCEICGAKRVQAHHVDYTNPSMVRWLCKTHRKLAGK